MLAMKTNKVDKINPFHIKMLLGQIIEIEETGYVRIGTEYEKVVIVIVIVIVIVNFNYGLLYTGLFCHNIQ